MGWGRRGGVEIVVGSWLALVRWEVCRPGAASVVVRRFRAAEGQPRLDAVLPQQRRLTEQAPAAMFLVCLIC